MININFYRISIENYDHNIILMQTRRRQHSVDRARSVQYRAATLPQENSFGGVPGMTMTLSLWDPVAKNRYWYYWGVSLYY